MNTEDLAAVLRWTDVTRTNDYDVCNLYIGKLWIGQISKKNRENQMWMIDIHSLDNDPRLSDYENLDEAKSVMMNHIIEDIKS